MNQHTGAAPGRGPQEPTAGATSGILGPELRAAGGASFPASLMKSPAVHYGMWVVIVTGWSWKGMEMMNQQQAGGTHPYDS